MSIVNSARSVASLVPAKARGVIYTMIGTAVLVEGIWDLVPEVLEGKVLKTITVLGFGLALGNTGDSQPSEVREVMDFHRQYETPDGPYPT